MTVAVMPAYNEENRIAAAVAKTKVHVSAIIVIDDGSRDQTAEVARKAGAIVLRHSLNRGQGAALKTGNQAALKLGAKVIVHLDADGQHDPSFIPNLVAPIISKESDVVYGSRFLGLKPEGMPLARQVILFGAKQFSALVLGIPRTMSDPQSGLRAMTSEAVRKLEFFQDRMAHCSELLRLVVKSDLRWREVPVTVSYTNETLAKGQEGANSVQAALKIVWQLFVGSFRK